MTDFFTPIEVPVFTESHSDKYELDKFNNDPFSPTTVRIQSLSDHRKKIIQWLKNMPIAMRMSKLMYTNKEFSCLLIAMYDRSSRRNQDCLSQFGISYDKQHGFKIMEQRFIAKPNLDLLQAEHKLLSSIVIANRYSTFDSISVDFSLASDINKLFDLFDVIQNGITHEITKINYKNYNQIQDSHLMFFNPSEEDYAVAKTLGAWFVQVIKKNLSVQFLKDCEEQKQKLQKDAYCQTGEQKTNQHSCSQKLVRVKQKAKNFKIYWNRLNLEQRENLVKKVISRDIRKILNDYRHTIGIYGDSFPCIKYCHPEEISQFMSDMVRLEGEYLFNELTYIKLEDAVFDRALYQYELMLEIELEIQKSKNKKNQVAVKKNAKLLTKKKTTKNQEKSKKNNKTFEQEKLFTKNSTMSQTQKTLNCHQLSVPPKKKQSIKSTKPKTRISLISSSKQTSETTNDQQSDNQYLDEILQQTQIKSSQKMAELQFGKIVNEFEVKTAKWNKYQQIAINRLASVLQFYHLSFHLFGSFANGLAICQSDVDVCVDPNIVHFFYTSFCSYRDKVIMALQFLQHCFQTMNWAGNFNLITTASVPVLVFEIDLSIVYGDGKNSLFNCAKSQKGPKICIDLTIEPFANTEKQLVPHLGYQSTSLVSEWVSEYQNLASIVKILKRVLYKKQLNKSFFGGISSYTLTTLIYAYLKTGNNRKEDPLMTTLIGFCKFIQKFDEMATTVDIGNIQPFQSKKTEKLTVINCLNGKNMTEHCHRFPQIKALIIDLLQALNSYEAGFNKKQYSKKLRNLFLQ